MSIEFRPARPGDAEAAVPLIHSSGPAAFDFAFKTDVHDSISFLHNAFRHGAGTFGFRNHVVGVVDGQVIATGTAYSGDTTITESFAVALQIVSTYRLGAGSIISRGLKVESVIRPPKRGVHYLAHLGVAEEARGHGYGSAMIRHLHESGRQLGRSTAELDVAVTNTGAQSLYERLGYRTVRRQRSSLENRFGRIVDHCRMAIAL